MNTEFDKIEFEKNDFRDSDGGAAAVKVSSLLEEYMAESTHSKLSATQKSETLPRLFFDDANIPKLESIMGVGKGVSSPNNDTKLTEYSPIRPPLDSNQNALKPECTMDVGKSFSSSQLTERIKPMVSVPLEQESVPGRPHDTGKASAENVAQKPTAEDIRHSGRMVNKDANNAIDEIYAVNKNGKLEHWVRVRTDEAGQYWTVDYSNRSKQEVINSALKAERVGINGGDRPIQMNLNIDSNGDISFKKDFSYDGSHKASVTHHINKAGLRTTESSKDH
jgi:hypothetical protein